MEFNLDLPHGIQISEQLPPSIEPLSTETQFNNLPSDYLQRIGSTLMQSIQMTYLAPHSSPTMPGMPINSFMGQKTSSNLSTVDELQKQLEYDKFMNEIWIGIVLTLVLISMIFCICSCLLYHQFRTWKRNYHRTMSQSGEVDIEAFKVQPADLDDPVPEYTLVSGLPTYEAALELLQSTEFKVTTTMTNDCEVHGYHRCNYHVNGNVNNQDALQQQQQACNEVEINDIHTPLLTTKIVATTTTDKKDNETDNNNNQQQQQQQQQLEHETKVNYLACVNEKPNITATSSSSSSSTSVDATTSRTSLEKLPENRTNATKC